MTVANDIRTNPFIRIHQTVQKFNGWILAIDSVSRRALQDKENIISCVMMKLPLIGELE